MYRHSAQTNKVGWDDRIFQRLHCTVSFLCWTVCSWPLLAHWREAVVRWVGIWWSACIIDRGRDGGGDGTHIGPTTSAMWLSASLTLLPLKHTSNCHDTTMQCVNCTEKGSFGSNTARIANTVQCHSLLSDHYDCGWHPKLLPYTNFY